MMKVRGNFLLTKTKIVANRDGKFCDLIGSTHRCFYQTVNALNMLKRNNSIATASGVVPCVRGIPENKSAFFLSSFASIYPPVQLKFSIRNPDIYYI